MAVSDTTQRKNKSNWSGAIRRVDILPDSGERTARGGEGGEGGRLNPMAPPRGGDLAVGRSSDTALPEAAGLKGALITASMSALE